jgi:hypothetical protein
LNTAATLLANAPASYVPDELDAVGQVVTKDALRQLVHRYRLYLREMAGRYLASFNGYKKGRGYRKNAHCQ